MLQSTNETKITDDTSAQLIDADTSAYIILSRVAKANNFQEKAEDWGYKVH